MKKMLLVLSALLLTAIIAKAEILFVDGDQERGHFYRYCNDKPKPVFSTYTLLTPYEIFSQTNLSIYDVWYFKARLREANGGGSSDLIAWDMPYNDIVNKHAPIEFVVVNDGPSEPDLENGEYYLEIEITSGVNYIYTSSTNTIWVQFDKMSTTGWHHTPTIEPNFSGVSTGPIAANFGNNEGYLIGTDNRVYTVSHNAGDYHIYPMDPNFYGAAPGGLAVNQDNGEVYFIGTDNRIYNGAWYSNAWHINPLVSNFYNAAPGSVAVNQGNGHVYFIGTDGRVYTAYWASSQWNIFPLDQNFTGAAAGAISVNQNNGEVYVIGTNGKVYNFAWWSGAWHVNPLVNNFTSAAPGALDVNNSNGHVFFIGTDNKLYNAYWGSGQWNIFSLDNSYTSAQPGALVINQNNGAVFYITTGHKLTNAVWDNNQWNMWTINNSYNAEYGSIGLMQFVERDYWRTMLVSKNEFGNLDEHYWHGCSGDYKNGSTTSINKPEQQYINMGELKIYPNPVTNATTISYNLNETGNISLGLYDVKGAKVRDIVEKQLQQKGAHSYKMERNYLSPGLYFLVMQADNGTKNIQKIVIE